tara:strand:+ start:12719 stop:13384 length:666 start_codon:yes stop_codon:yes gene_type:complete
MNDDLDSCWVKELDNTFNEPYFLELASFIKEEYSNYTCYPPYKNIFAALNNCPLNKLKVVIIGQDPYHGIGQANGYCFSVPNGTIIPPSLINIFKELKNDLNVTIPNNGDLTKWSNQGVLLLNSILTVRENIARSHQNRGWEIFTDRIIKTISSNKNNIVFLLWGTYAKSKANLIDNNKHNILTCGHPSPLSANRGYWFGNKHFSKTNKYLKSNGLEEIIW